MSLRGLLRLLLLPLMPGSPAPKELQWPSLPPSGLSIQMRGTTPPENGGGFWRIPPSGSVRAAILGRCGIGSSIGDARINEVASHIFGLFGVQIEIRAECLLGTLGHLTGTSDAKT